MRNEIIMHRLQLISMGRIVPQINSTSLYSAPTSRSDLMSLMTISILLRILESASNDNNNASASDGPSGYFEDYWKTDHPRNGQLLTTPWTLSCLRMFKSLRCRHCEMGQCQPYFHYPSDIVPSVGNHSGRETCFERKGTLIPIFSVPIAPCPTFQEPY